MPVAVMPLVVGAGASLWLNSGCAEAPCYVACNSRLCIAARWRVAVARRLTPLSLCAFSLRSVSVPQRLLRGLRAYHLAPGDADAPPPEASKKDKKARPEPHNPEARLRLTRCAHAGRHQPGCRGARAQQGRGALLCRWHRCQRGCPRRNARARGFVG
jgi:hypothetical protein